MSDDLDSSVVFSDEHPGVSGIELCIGIEKCESCGNTPGHLFRIVGDTPLGDLLEIDTVEIETQDGLKNVPGNEPICEPCLEHLIEAKQLSDQNNEL